MTDEHVHEFRNAAETFQETAGKVEDGINKVLEPEVKDARISMYDTQRMMASLAKRTTYLFAVSIVINALTLWYVVTLVQAR